MSLHDNPVFHGGPGVTVEMRRFAYSAINAHLRAAGFVDIEFLNEDVSRLLLKAADGPPAALGR